MTIFLKARKQSSVDKFVTMLKVLDKSPCNKFHLMCAVETNTASLNGYLDKAYKRGLVTQDGKLFFITDKGRRLLGAWE